MNEDPFEQLTDDLADDAVLRGAEDAAELLAEHDDEVVSEVLQKINPAIAQDVLEEFDGDRQAAILAAAPRRQREQWLRNQGYEEDSIGRLMDASVAVFGPELTVAATIDRLREIVKTHFVTYSFVTMGDRLVGVVTMRDLLLSSPAALLGDVMIRDPFHLSPETPLRVAMKQVLNLHYPVYPVCDGEGTLIGQVRGQTMFEERAFEISAQPGSMVGVDKEERLATAWPRSLQFRHPWLQLNLLTAFVAAAVVGIFQDTIDRIVILAVFLPVLAGQSGNTGCQALAVALRGMTLGELEPGRERALVMKEALLGLFNGSLVGITAGVGMFLVARAQSNHDAPMLALVVFVAMTVSCVVSGVSGAMIPLTLRKLGADPATASSIFLTTATDVASMGVFLGLASILVR